MERIPRVQVSTTVVNQIPKPSIRDTPPPVVSGLEVPVIDVPVAIIEYPVIDVPTEQDFRQQMSPQEQETGEEEGDTRELPKTEKPTITIAGVEAPLPEPAPLITAGATAVVTTTVTLAATIAVGKIKDAVLEPMMKRASAKKKKIKIKKVKPVLHFVQSEEGHVEIFEYGAKGTKMIDKVDDVERYIRDQVELDSLYEMDNKIIIDDVIKDKFTKEGAKRFKSLFAPAKTIAKKLSAKFSI